MRRYLTTAVFCACLLAFGAEGGKKNPMDSLIVVETDVGRGTGFLCRIGEDRYIITNTHVIEAAKSINLSTTQGRKFRPDKIELADNQDLARLHIPDEDVETLKMAGEDPAIGARVYVYGDSGGMQSITKLSGDVKGLGPDVVEISAEFVQGNSGGPILDYKSDVLGVATFIVKPAKGEWHTKDTPFDKPRRFGVRLTGRIKWIEVPYPRFFAEASALRDVDSFMQDMHHVSKLLGLHPVQTREGFQKIMLSKETLKSKRYHDADYAEHILRISRNYVQFSDNAQKYSVSSYSVKSHLDRFFESLKHTPTLAREKLQKARWSTSHYRERAKEYVDLFETWEKDIEHLKSKRYF
ncbi:MAG: trypsin-like peptidase domain-containing protein [Kiritimatiellae bacterium]|nr:trypsin-like peptidase domain-containing protein [Kiritimatiellia bacterium]